MKIIKADNYQTWYIEENNQALLIDPWLSNKLKPDKSFFIQREKENVIYISNDQIKKVKAIIITAPFDDHLHLESIEKLSSKLPIYTSKIVKKILTNFHYPKELGRDQFCPLICTIYTRKIYSKRWTKMSNVAPRCMATSRVSLCTQTTLF